MTKDEYQDFALRYKGCGACFPMYHTLSRFEKMWFTAIQKDVAELEKENAELKAFKQDCIKLTEDNVVMTKQRGEAVIQLTKAKEIIKDYLTIVKGSHTTVCGVPEESRTIYVLQLNEKAEEFLNSEVEE